MKSVAVVLMQFPQPSETFASGDIKSLYSSVDSLSVHPLRLKTKKTDGLIKERELDNIPIYNLSYIQFFKSLLCMFFSFKKLFFLLNVICFENGACSFKERIKQVILLPSVFYQFNHLKKIQPDIIHLFWGHYPSLLGILVKKYMENCKLSTFLGAYDLELDLPVTRKCLLSSDFVFTHTNGNRNIIKNKYNVDAKVIYRGFDFNKYKAFISLNVKKDPFLICSVGRLIKEKGFDDVINVFSKIFKNDSRYRLLIIGDGPYKNELVKLSVSSNCDKSITFLGHLSHEDTMFYIGSSTFFIFMSYYKGERLPNVVKEAMALSTVSIVSQTQDIQELITDKTDGFIVNQRDVNAAVDVFDALSNYRAIDFLELQRKGVVKISSKFSLDNSVRTLLNTWF
ncbi:glycosyltransferase family 4 protein [Shewanella sp. MMG014]|uniref:glycosyltransferase family 4 protein n=1 Tax=Shewanella sp. MMG014 TaxID=2822691 RepID=UPI001B38C7CE|nr:glycosyltransferase family 4 protein [Shewanella sp. MMG014]MBQ4888541.1 glycosyltransferase family 4 protein [Shewanella sp. MMG014]